jgi:hypothetical protein
MKLINLIPLKEIEDIETSTPELLALPYFREFQTAHGYKPLFKFIGIKDDETIFVADLTNFGILDVVIKDAKLYAKVTEKYAMFGIVMTLTGLDKIDATVCRMNQKDGKIERIMYDSKDKKNFDNKSTNFLKLTEEK